MNCLTGPKLLPLVLAGLSIAVTSGRAAAAERDPARPNILFILLDNVGKDWFRCYGSQENVTPHIDRLAREGLQFRNFYITPVCSTSRHMLLTGRYPFRTGWHTHHDPAIYGGGYFDWNRELTFARVLKQAGYRTAISGKWQINDFTDPDQKNALAEHGFEEHCLWPEGPKGHPAHKQRYWDPYILINGEHVDRTGQFGPDVCCDWMIDYMSRRRDEPFLAYYSAILTHIPVVETPDNRGREMTAREKFAGMVRYADRIIGRFVDGLQQAGLRENTIVFIVADNGTDNGTDQGDAHSLGGRINGRVSGEGIYSLRERGINVPFIVNCPGIVPAGFSDDLIDASDVLPTLAGLAGASLPEDRVIDGWSLAPQLRGEEPERPWREWCLTQYYTRRVVRSQRFKLYSTGEFYDLSEDPLEQHDLSDAERLLEDETTLAGHAHLQDVLDSLPPDAKLPFEFRSISARRIRAEEAARQQK